MTVNKSRLDKQTEFVMLISLPLKYSTRAGETTTNFTTGTNTANFDKRLATIHASHRK